ncbi:DUF5681 domain-containing protein [Bradyrhizobium sp. P5_C11_2]
MSDDAIRANGTEATHADESVSEMPAREEAAGGHGPQARTATGRFRPGQSGNSRGRPRKEPEPVFAMMARVLGEAVPLTRGGKVVEMSCSEAIFRAMCHRAMTDPRLGREVFRLAIAREAAVDTADIDARLAQGEAALANFIARVRRQARIDLTAESETEQDSVGDNDNPPSDPGASHE